MASALSGLSNYKEDKLPSGKTMKIGIVVADWNEQITHALYDGCKKILIKHKVLDENIFTLQVPGAFELPFGAKALMTKQPVDAVICLGCVIKGETKHNEYINMAVANGLTNLGLATGKPIIFGLLTTENESQALDRAGGKHGNKGVESAVTAIRMVAMNSNDSTLKNKIGF